MVEKVFHNKNTNADQRYLKKMKYGMADKNN